MDYFVYELEAITRWVKSMGLNSMLLSTAPPKVARPVILWETPQRNRLRNNSRYSFVNQVRQYGRFFAADLRQLLAYQSRLQLDLEDRENILDVYDGTGTVIGKLRNVSVRFENGEGLDSPFSVEYEASYQRIRPAEPGPATTVTTRTVVPPPGLPQ